MTINFPRIISISVATSVATVLILIASYMIMDTTRMLNESKYRRGTMLYNMTRIINALERANQRNAEYEEIIRWKIRQGAF